MTFPQAPETRADNTTTLILDALYEKVVAIIATQVEHGNRLAEILHSQEMFDTNMHLYTGTVTTMSRRLGRVEDNQRKHNETANGQSTKLDKLLGLLRRAAD